MGRTADSRNGSFTPAADVPRVENGAEFGDDDLVKQAKVTPIQVCDDAGDHNQAGTNCEGSCAFLLPHAACPAKATNSGNA